METGRRNRKVLIQVRAAGEDDNGQPNGPWGNLIAAGDGKIYANVKYLNGTETIKADSAVSSAKVSIRIRYRTSVTAGMQVLLGSTTYSIKAVLMDEAGKEYTDLACEVVT